MDTKAYEREKLGIAVGTLASSAEPIQKRLEYAGLTLTLLSETEPLVNPERNRAFRSIYERLTADKSVSTGRVHATTARLSDDEASAIARDIVDLYSGICHDRIYELEDELQAAKAARR